MGNFVMSPPFDLFHPFGRNPPGETITPHVADANERLSMLGLATGQHVIQDDSGVEYIYNGDAEAVQIIGAGTAAANGYYTKRGTYEGYSYYVLIGNLSSVTHASVYRYHDVWKISAEGEVELYTSTDDVAFPWLVTTWNTAVGGDGPAPTTAHISSKNALLTAVFISGAGTAAANGIYTERPALGLVLGARLTYNLLGQSDSLTNYAIAPSEPAIPDVDIAWTIYDSGGTALYASADNVLYPWEVVTWVAVTGDSPAPTAASKTQGELDAGVLVTGATGEAGAESANQSYKVATPVVNRNSYVGLLNAGWSLIDPDAKDNNWVFNDGSNRDPNSSTGDNPAFPWEATFNDSAVVTENPIASESNWEPISP